MKKRIYIEIPSREDFVEFINNESIDIEIVNDQVCDIKVIRCSERMESDLNAIYSGGGITCEMALSMAKEMGVSLSQMGHFMNHLEVKIRKCSLGCFK